MLTLEEQIIWCRKCTKSKFSKQEGILCSLTGEKPSFDPECAHFERDPLSKDYQISSAPELLQDIKNDLNYDALEILRLEQNLPAAIFTGIVSSFIGAILWMTISLLSGLNFGIVAIAIGIIVGFSIRHFGKGIDKVFGIIGAAFSLFGVLFGYFLSIVGLIAKFNSISIFQVLLSLDFNIMGSIIQETFSVYMVFFGLLAMAEGYKLSYRQLSRKEVLDLNKQKR